MVLAGLGLPVNGFISLMLFCFDPLNEVFVLLYSTLFLILFQACISILLSNCILVYFYTCFVALGTESWGLSTIRLFPPPILFLFIYEITVLLSNKMIKLVLKIIFKYLIIVGHYIFPYFHLVILIVLRVKSKLTSIDKSENRN